MNKTIGASALALAISAMAPAMALAQDDPVTLRFSHFTPPMHPLHVGGIVPWAESIHEASGGSITVEIYPGQQLGQAGDHYDMARDGIADFALVNAGYHPGRFPIIATGEQPFMVTNARGGSAALDAWYRAYAEEEMDDTHFCLAHHHPPGTFHSKVPIRHPDDVRGMNVRPANATMAAFVSALGGQVFQVSAPEARDALERGIADALTFPWHSVLVFGLDNSVSYHLEIPLYATTFVWAMNRDSYDRLSDAQKEVIDAHCSNDWVERVAGGWQDAEDESREQIAGREGHEVIVPTDEEVAAWREAAAGLEDRWAEAVRGAGKDPEEVRAGLIAELEKRDSAY
jgi:TRAP-type transport system periplasmic protein